ncbi:hypothetical protein [Neorhizobium sp. SHOUNA12B]|uniref:hypothetical protein n=1 Tax=Neorhizobium sp. SHOUNA12B TaxID=2908928 RepID=UPI0025D61EC9|nr:hypothetical protein [Neorhizobium sp. SHOUNA12B]MCJ9671440.1 hypothetical protein [Neorhizobium sp. SHOUNA12B]
MTTSLKGRFAQLVGQDPSFRPPRVITRGGHRVRGIFPSARFKRPMHWESGLQCDLVYRLEASWLVADACTRPTTINVALEDGTQFGHTPHAVVMRWDGQLVCLECIPSKHLREASVLKRLAAIRQRLADLSVQFLVVTEAHLDLPIARRNARMLTQALRTARPDERDAEDCVQLARRRPEVLTDLAALLGTDASLRMLALGYVYADMHQPLGAATSLTYTLEEHFDAADFIHTK